MLPSTQAHVLGALLGAALSLAAAAAPAQEPPPTAGDVSADAPLLPIRFDLDLYGALTARLSGGGDTVDRGGGQLGVSALGGPRDSWWTAGLAYERSFFGTETIDDADAGTFLRVGRGLDAIWLLGRAYSYEDGDLSLYGTLGLAPVWQRASVSGTVTEQGTGGFAGNTRSVSCSTSATPGLGIRIGMGAKIAITRYLGLTTGIGVDHVSLSDEPLDGCASGMGSSMFLAGRVGFTITEGRRKAAPPLPPPPPPDRDGDGIVDAGDACPTVPGVPSADPAKHGCPPPGDADGDRITDDVDACPTVPGVPDQDPKKHGCPPPPDRDADKVIDAQDACPDIAGVPTPDPATNGCPPDSDGDSIRDDKDACPKIKGLPNEDPKKNGCPLVLVTEKEIVIGQQVQFETDRAIIRPESNGLLDEVAGVVKAHPEILKIEVQGHTDNSGTKIRNKLLSIARAEAVMKALVKRGVDAKVLTSNGYGDTVPIASNETPEGKAQNRRVQFKILEKK